jgi:glucose-1-phosphate adenylyltransferase
VESQADLTTCGPGAHVFRRDVLIQLLRKHVGENNGVSFEKDIIPGVIRSGRAALFHFSGYCRTISTLDDYYTANMDFASGNIDLDAYQSVVWPIRTLSGTKQLQKVRSAVNSRVALGARLIGSKISNSVIASGVRVETGAQIENSIILGGTHVGSGARLRNAIVCEGATIAAFDQIGFNEDLDQKRFAKTSAGIVIVPGGSGDRPQYVQRRSARVATKAHCAVAH